MSMLEVKIEHLEGIEASMGSQEVSRLIWNTEMLSKVLKWME